MKRDTKNPINSGLELRTPIVTVLGHVDHGKTTLLDKIRNTSVAAREAGGITQSIGASVIKLEDDREITFIDTPGHAAFSSMRSRGIKIADIAILVVACDDGVKPQTREALAYILESKTPFVVAATKIDMQSADIELVKSSLEKEGVMLEGKGGDIPIIPVSGKTGQGVKELLEMIMLVWEMKNQKSNPNDPLEAYIFEVGKDRRGNFASVVVKNGSLSVGDEIVLENNSCKIRGMFDYQGLQTTKVLPGSPCQIIGFAQSPAVGSQIWKKNDNTNLTLPLEKKSVIPIIGKDQIGIIIKAQNAGSLDALKANLPKDIVIVGSSVGEVIEADVFLAKSTQCAIYVFEANASVSILKLADMEGVKVYKFDIIYELFKHLEDEIKKGIEEETGTASIISQFPYENKKVAGCKVITGKIQKSDILTLKRGEKVMGSVKIISMKKGKVDILEAKQGEEFGIIFVPQLEFLAGDVILSVK